MPWIILAISIVANAGASMLVKVGMGQLQDGSDRIRAIIFNPWLWLGVILYGIAFVTYAIALKLFPLNLAHPVLTAGAIAVVVAGSVIWFGEALPISALLGLLFIICGVTLISWRPF